MTIQVLKADFAGNHYYNNNPDITGCPLIRGLVRAGITGKENIDKFYCKIPLGVDFKVIEMLDGTIPAEDFTFEL